MKLIVFLFSQVAFSQLESKRSVCPMLNALANRGLINCTFTLPQITKVFSEQLNLDPSVSAALFNGAIEKGLNATAAKDSLSLTSINAPGVSEHDASLVREDFALSASFQDYLTVDPKLVAQLVASNSTPGGLTAADLGRFRKSRIIDSKSRNQNFTFSQSIAIRSAGESALMTLIFGKNGTIPTSDLETFFLREQFPRTYVKPADPITFRIFEASLKEALFLFQ
jgi:hypothetical protein